MVSGGGCSAASGVSGRGLVPLCGAWRTKGKRPAPHSRSKPGEGGKGCPHSVPAEGEEAPFGHVGPLSLTSWDGHVAMMASHLWRI